MPIIKNYSTSPIIEDLERTLDTLGYFGSKDNVTLIYLGATSRLLPGNGEKLDIYICGPSGIGKSIGPNIVKELLPEDQVIDVTRITKAYIYNQDENFFANKWVYAHERPRFTTKQDMGDRTEIIRQLRTDGYVSDGKSTMNKEGNWNSSKARKIFGPISYCETSTYTPSEVFTEDLNRSVVIQLSLTEEEENFISDTAIERKMNPISPEVIDCAKQKHRLFQASLKPVQVYIPWLGLIKESFRGKPHRTRNQITTTIETCALLHQHDRTPDQLNRIHATFSDYSLAYRVLEPCLSKPVIDQTRARVEDVHKLLAWLSQIDHAARGEIFTADEARAVWKISQPGTSKRLDQMYEADVIKLTGLGENRRKLYQKTGTHDPTPVMPQPEELRRLMVDHKMPIT